MDHDFDDKTDETVGVSIHAGFPNPAADHRSNNLDFNKMLVQHPSSTYCFRVQGKAHEDNGIFDGDVAVIDRALSPRPSDLVIYWQDDTFVLCIYRTLRRPIEIWGVVTATIHPTRAAKQARRQS